MLSPVVTAYKYAKMLILENAENALQLFGLLYLKALAFSTKLIVLGFNNSDETLTFTFGSRPAKLVSTTVC